MQTNERESRLFISAAINNIEINYRLKLSIINHFIFIIVDFAEVIFLSHSLSLSFVTMFQMESGDDAGWKKMPLPMQI